MKYTSPKIKQDYVESIPHKLTDYADEVLVELMSEIEVERRSRAFDKFEDAIKYSIHVYGVDDGVQIINQWHESLLSQYVK